MSNKNIITIHNTIIDNFAREKTILPDLKKKIEDIRCILTDDKLSSANRGKLEREVETLLQRYNEIESDSKLNFYLLETVPIIKRYETELNKPIEINFMGEPKRIDTRVMDQIHDEYVQVVEAIVPVEKRHVYNHNKVCPSCDSVSLEQITEKTNACVCSQCGTERDELEITFSYKDSDRINITSKYMYDRKVHFKECIDQFQGKQNSTIKQEVYDKLIEQFRLHGLVREGDLPNKIKYEKITKNHITLFLREINYANHYEDLNLIYHKITENELDDISHLKNVLMEDFDKLSTIYNEEYIKNKKISRKNFINTQYVLFQLLRRHKYPCSQNDFSLLKTIERKEFHDEICSHLFKKLGWNFTPVF